MSKPNYVVGFKFDSQDRVALIKKNRPKYQAGLLNGIGGKIEKGESSLEAMLREFEEEAGSYVTGWKQFADIKIEDGSHIYCFAVRSDKPVHSVTDEDVLVYDYRVVPDNKTMANLPWLVNMALYSLDWPGFSVKASYGLSYDEEDHAWIPLHADENLLSPEIRSYTPTWKDLGKHV